MYAVEFSKSMTNYESSIEEKYKKINGIFYTDLFLADKMIKELKLDKDSIIIDPCCGTGSFLVSALVNKYKNIYGVDKDRRAIEFCKQHVESGLVRTYDTLANSGDDILKTIGLDDKVDCVIGNPPYVPIADGVVLNNCDFKFMEKVRSYGNNLFVAALLRAFELAKENAIISYIIPKNFLHISSYSGLRKYILENKQIVSIIDLGVYFKKVRGEQIILTIKNSLPNNNNIDLKILSNGKFKRLFSVNQSFYTDNILLFRGKSDFNVYNKLSSAYKTLGDLCAGYVGRGKSRSYSAVVGKDIRKFGYKNRVTPNEGNTILMQNIYSAESGIIAAFGGTLEAAQTVTIFTDGNKDKCKYILGILHSRLCNFYLYKYCYNYSRLTMHTDAKYLKKIPLELKDENDAKYKDLVNLVETIEQTKYMSEEWYDLMEELNRKVYKIYRINKTEIQFIESEMRLIQSRRWFKDAE